MPLAFRLNCQGILELVHPLICAAMRHWKTSKAVSTDGDTDLKRGPRRAHPMEVEIPDGKSRRAAQWPTDSALLRPPMMWMERAWCANGQGQEN
mmetsp:Transcript_109091/g.204632  ORF Transcript_109091/g.204632 Transcript_109091/m.204632 type:complete len:94 (-) Transcript_109091:58-339(-)